MISGRDIVCLSSQDWTDLWTRKQRFMQRFARQGNRVLYVETQASLVSLPLITPDPGRLGRWLAGPRTVEANLHVATLPPVWPFFQMSLAVNAIDNALLAPLLRRWIRRLGFRAPLLWTYNPYSETLVGALGESFVVYDCVDELAAAQGLIRPTVVRELERRLVDKADLVIVTHENLRPARSRPGRPAHLIPNGADLAHFEPASRRETAIAPELAGMPHPLVGFVGSVQYWIDFDLIRFLARARPAWSFVLIGPSGRLARIEKIADLANVHLLGRRPYEALPFYVRAFDVCLNPYVVDEGAWHRSPLKLYEYLASGKPIVSVDMPEARKFTDVIGIGRSYAEVLQRLDEALMHAPDDPVPVRRRLRAAAPHAWDRRFRDLEAILEPLLAERTGLAAS